MPVRHTTILRHLKRSAGERDRPTTVRVAGIDDWAWKKGMTYGTVIVDLERRRVVDLLADRSAAATAAWLKCHPEVEVVSRDRAGLYADAVRKGAPQARQVADRYHLLQNFREAVERQLIRLGRRSGERHHPLMVDRGRKPLALAGSQKRPGDNARGTVVTPSVRHCSTRSEPFTTRIERPGRSLVSWVSASAASNAGCV